MLLVAYANLACSERVVDWGVGRKRGTRVGDEDAVKLAADECGGVMVESEICSAMKNNKGV